MWALRFNQPCQLEQGAVMGTGAQRLGPQVWTQAKRRGYSEHSRRNGLFVQSTERGGGHSAPRPDICWC